MKLPIDTSAMTFLAAGPAEPVLDFDTKAAKVDANGEALYAVQLVTLLDGAAEVINVKVPGQPKSLNQGTPVKVTGLVAQPWSMGDRAGVAYRAERIDAATGAKSAA